MRVICCSFFLLLVLSLHSPASGHPSLRAGNGDVATASAGGWRTCASTRLCGERPTSGEAIKATMGARVPNAIARDIPTIVGAAAGLAGGLMALEASGWRSTDLPLRWRVAAAALPLLFAPLVGAAIDRQFAGGRPGAPILLTPAFSISHGAAVLGIHLSL